MNEIAGLGFDTLMTRGDGDVGSLLQLTSATSLQLMLQVSLDRPLTHSKLAHQHPDWMDHGLAANDALPDPRKAGEASTLPALRLERAETAEAAAHWWIAELSSLTEKGVAGFALHLDGHATPDFFREVIDGVRVKHAHCRFLAWTVGAPADRVASLTACGFDGAFTSSAWWDFRSPWLAEEAGRLAPFQCLIATAGRPGERIVPSDVPLLAQRLWLVAATGNGLMVSGDLLSAVSPDVIRQALSTVAPAAEKSADSLRRWALISVPDAPVAVLLYGSASGGQWVMATNAGESAVTVDILSLLAKTDGLTIAKEDATGKAELQPTDSGMELKLEPHETWVKPVRAQAWASVAPKDSKRTVDAAVKLAAKAPRIAIENISPCVDQGRFLVKRCVGDTLVVEADLFGEGHDRIAAALRWRAIDEDDWHETDMRSVVNDRWRAQFLLPRVGRFEYQIEAWIDVFGAYRNEIEKKTAAGQQVALELQEGALLLEAARQRAEAGGLKEQAKEIARFAKAFVARGDQASHVARMLSPELHRLMVATDDRAFKVGSEILAVDSERSAAGFSSWYELFPRSMGVDAATHGTFADVLPRLPAIRAMGFDTLYFPPIHPIGMKHRKGRNNALVAGEDDPGSPYAIGSTDGGHDAIHPELGTLEDFRFMLRAVHDHRMELALDFAIQCSPDHPWLKEHPDWFTWRPDGTIRYAENPPKKYQDIVNIDFYAEGAVPRLWVELRNVVLFWVNEGVKLFRVDNPHTKPMPFWEWLIGDVRARNPDVVFLAEAFTRPKPMYRLAKLGFSQSYTYFTWRHTKQEFIDYLTELTEQAPRDFFRPHFFVNTPDINPYFLQRSGRAGFVIRAALAATLSGLWGMYSGFELCEGEPVPGKDEYLDSEKYELRQRNWSQPGNIVGEITLLNKIRRSNPALQTHVGVQFCRSSGEDFLCFTKTSPGNVLLVAICLDPHASHECDFELPLEHWKLGEDARIACEDLIYGNTFMLNGRHQRLRLDPAEMAFSIWRLKVPGVY